MASIKELIKPCKGRDNVWREEMKQVEDFEMPGKTPA